MPRLWSEAPCLHLERARDREGGSKTAWCTDCWRGECLGRGGGGGSQRSQMHPQATRNVKKQQKMGCFPHLLT